MLTGKIIYKSGGKNYKYNVLGADTSASLSLRLESSNYNAMAELAKVDGVEPEDSNVLWSRRMDVHLANIVVETVVHKIDGKKVKEPLNSDFFCRLGATLRYIKSHCTTANIKGNLGLALASKEFEAVPVNEYEIKFPTDEYDVLAKVKLEFGDIVDLLAETDDFIIELETTNEVDFLAKIVDGIKLGVQFNTEYLGFEVPEQVVEEVSTDNGMYTCIEDIVMAHPDKEFSWLLKKDYKIVSDEELDYVIAYLMDDKWEYVYYDTETTGLNINFKSRIGQADQLVGVVLSVKYGESFYFPVQMKSIKNLCGGDHWYFMQKYMKPLLETKKLVAHTMSFDWKVAYIYDINANIVHDTMAIIKLTLGTERKDYPMGLKDNARLILNRDSLELSDLVVDDSWGTSDIRFWDLPYELVKLYACADTDNTNGLLQYAIQTDLLNRYNARKVYEIEIAFSFAVAYQEFYGHHIDISNVDTMKGELYEEQARLKKEMNEIVGHDFNPNSPKQLQTVMYKELGVPEQKDRKTGNLTTNKQTLEKLAEITDIEGNTMYPFCEKLLKFRKYEGVRKVVDKFPEHMTKDGFIFSSVMQYGTTTGRVSIHEPNYQSYNDPVKKNVVPRPGYYMFDTDYSSVEYRILANMVGNKRIMESFKDPDFDYHTYQAAHMYNVPYDAVTKPIRKAAKSINFGLPYGMGDESLGEKIYGVVTPENTRKAKELKDAYFKGQEDIRDWFEEGRNKGVQNGYTETYFGRRRYYHRQDFSVASIRRQAGNHLIQGTAADIYKLAVGRVFKRICKEGWLGKVLLDGFIHDEVLGEVSNDINPGEFLKMLREEFEVKITNSDGSPWCPLYMGFGYGMSWYEAKSVELPIKLQWEIVERYGETGFPDWDGDGRKFCDTIPDRLRDFDVRDVGNQLLDQEAQGKEIKLTLNKQMLSCLEEDKRYYNNAINDYISEVGDENLVKEVGYSKYLETVHETLEKYLDKNCHIQKLYKNEDGEYVEDFDVCDDTQKLIDQYCMLHDVDRSKINVLNIKEFEMTSNENSSDDIPSVEEYDEEEELARRLEEMKKARLRTLGMFVEPDLKKVTVLYLNDNVLNFVMERTNKENKGYSLLVRDVKNNKLYDMHVCIDSKEIRTIQEMYINVLKHA